MKTNIKIYSLSFLILFLSLLAKAERVSNGNPIDNFCIDFEFEMTTAQYEYANTYRQLVLEIKEVNNLLIRQSGKSRKKFRKTLDRKFDLENKLSISKRYYEVTTLEIRYKKGIDLIKLLYEKILGLEHHFTGMQVYQNVAMLSNPNAYPEFKRAKEVLSQKRQKRYALDMPSLLQSNPFMSATFTLVSTFLSNGNRDQRQKDFDEIACILDFTVRMNADLNTIRHEVEFLKKANENLKSECENLFTEYTKVIGYMVPLETCRQEDDWESLYEKLNTFISTMKEVTQGEQMMMLPTPNKNQVNLEFATRRVSDFIIKYSDFTNRGIQYYQKFDNIVSTYENENTCQEVIPRQFTELKFDIKSTIEKFSNTYNLPEIQGSRLKDLMFGQVQ